MYYLCLDRCGKFFCFFKVMVNNRIINSDVLIKVRVSKSYQIPEPDNVFNNKLYTRYFSLHKFFDNIIPITIIIMFSKACIIVENRHRGRSRIPRKSQRPAKNRKGGSPLLPLL